jgi:hypothetical protein
VSRGLGDVYKRQAYANGFLYGNYAPGKRIDPNIYREPDRFWVPSERDFVAVYAKSP